jgi:hypothetical protein
MACVERPEGPFGIGCECNDVADGVCPSASCGADPDCASCTPDCGGRQCGDNGCGGSCGTCSPGSTCNDEGTCESICVPQCDGRECGDDGCGGTCGTCDGDCTADGQCEGTCVPTCTGRECGGDGCGGSCGSCEDDLTCDFGTCGCGFFDTVTYQFTLADDDAWDELFGVHVTVRHINLDGTETDPDDNVLCDRAGCPGGQPTPSWTKIFLGCRERARVQYTYYMLGTGVTCESEQVIEGTPQIIVPAPTLDDEGGCEAELVEGFGVLLP